MLEILPVLYILLSVCRIIMRILTGLHITIPDYYFDNVSHQMQSASPYREYYPPQLETPYQTICQLINEINYARH